MEDLPLKASRDTRQAICDDEKSHLDHSSLAHLLHIDVALQTAMAVELILDQMAKNNRITTSGDGYVDDECKMNELSIFHGRRSKEMDGARQNTVRFVRRKCT